MLTAEIPDMARAHALASPLRGRLRAFCIGPALLALLAAFFVAASPAAAEETIESFRSDITVARDGTLHVAETIKVRAEGDQIKRGIYRDFPLTFEDADGKVHEVGFKLLSVTRDGKPEPHFTQSQGEYIRIYAGEESVFLERGRSYTYVFTYETDRQIRWFQDHAELYWNVTGNAWSFPIASALVRVTLPDKAAPVRWIAYTGLYGARGTDWRGAVTDGVLAVETTRTLGPGEGFTIAEEIPAGVVEPPSDLDNARYFLRDNRGAIIGGVGLVLVLGYYLVAWNAVGRDPKAGTIIPLFSSARRRFAGALRLHQELGLRHERAAGIHRRGALARRQRARGLRRAEGRRADARADQGRVARRL